MQRVNGLILPVLVLLHSVCWAQTAVSIRGKITSKQRPLEGAYVGAHADGKLSTTYVMTDRSGQFIFRALGSGTYSIFTQIPGFRKARRDRITSEAGKEAVVNFEVEPETDFYQLVEQATNSELTESLPLSQAERQALDYRCGNCHGAYYIAKSRFTLKEWLSIVSKMDNWIITPAGDIAPPTRSNSPSNYDPTMGPPGADDSSIANMLARVRGPESPNFPIKFQPRATGEMTRAVTTEYRIPRIGAAPRYVLVDPRGRYVWYSDWRANYLGRVDINSGEIKEYPIPGRDDRPPGFQGIRWDPFGELWAGQIWSGRAIRFDVMAERVTGIFAPPQEWVRLGSVTICKNKDGSVSYEVGDALVQPGGSRWALDPESGTFTLLNAGGQAEHPATAVRGGGDCDDNPWYGGWRSTRTINYRPADSGKVMEFPLRTPWSRPYNAIGDPAHEAGWAAPDVSDRVVRIDLKTGEVREYPLPTRGREIRNIDIDLSARPPAVWFVNQRLGSIVRFQVQSD